jgi:large subunit ribosomal protein L18
MATAKEVGRTRRKVRVRKKVFGTPQRPRLSVFRSAKHIYAQVIDDVSGVTLVSASTLDKALRANVDGDKVDCATEIGKALAQRCKEKNIDAVVFDRNGYRYHGRIKAVADGARDGGLQF